jgi:hypothetical protein
MAEDLTLIVKEDRLAGMDLETFYFVETNPKAMIDFVAHFVADENGNFLPKPEAVKKVLTGRTVADIKDIVEQLRDSMEEGVVPKE